MIRTPEKTAAHLSRRCPLRPKLALVLGSGFAAVAETVQSVFETPYDGVPGLTATQVEGHNGKLVIGHWEDTPVLLLCGRAHYYEGHSLAEITFPVRVAAACGARALVLSNAAGGINPAYRAGDFMALTDHINLMGANPLRGPVFGPGCFVDLSQTYDPFLNKLLAKAARQSRVRLHFGVYAAVSGPTYETPAEIRAFARLGADAVGMSTVPEAIVARQCGLRVAAISCITNPAAGLSERPITHAEVLAAGERLKAQSGELLRRFVRLLARSGTREER